MYDLSSTCIDSKIAKPTRFQAAVQEQLDDEPALNDMNDAMQKTNDAICKAANDVIGLAPAKRVNSWFDEECKDAVISKSRLETPKCHNVPIAKAKKARTSYQRNRNFRSAQQEWRCSRIL